MRVPAIEIAALKPLEWMEVDKVTGVKRTGTIVPAIKERT